MTLSVSEGCAFKVTCTNDQTGLDRASTYSLSPAKAPSSLSNGLPGV